MKSSTDTNLIKLIKRWLTSPNMPFRVDGWALSIDRKYALKQAKKFFKLDKQQYVIRAVENGKLLSPRLAKGVSVDLYNEIGWLAAKGVVELVAVYKNEAKKTIWFGGDLVDELPKGIKLYSSKKKQHES
ncbi:hypothetical protein EBZ39_17130 [bacterium]|nr:hypothetical protein [bacterium]